MPGVGVDGTHTLSLTHIRSPSPETQAVATDARDKPRMPVTIHDCGQLGETIADEDGAPAEDAAP